ncbi:SDR family NAD(P)-dependent oxidoreductase [Pseudonocardia kunmingensis]|uniref:NAD(P)-dependent dehydrogenase (Short-subunit alcohol dehydrogenase family) n=1 Tax=Pseudonocardia kunmingensis TaxID=630975 RepID=A0A543DPL0_9PSEU|nr:SDR family NAD(P)-dependent oxidoreductase [Pseudonocardia kunmingensis]TQM11257.1 NAD(P)-dependent dehydrogenase (short-subunit alcohol dehydrogenase family) [Pseudonocardia kunmingensis]
MSSTTGTRLTGKGAVVIGGGQTPGPTVGNGRATALTFAREGAKVLVVDLDEGSARDTVDEIRAAGGTATARRADITDEADCAALPGAAVDVLGRIDVLHHNVGIVPRGNSDELSLADWQHGFDVNLTGMWLVCKYVIPVMREAGGGSVVLISSLAGGLAGGATIAYTTAKAAVNSMGRSLALENAAAGVRVNVIAPGMIDTPMGVDDVARASGTPREQVAAQRAAMIPMGHQGTSWDVANAALFLASAEAAFVTGAILPVDGGSALGLPRT